jgi:cell wall-associated NlpC family hydrolase
MSRTLRVLALLVLVAAGCAAPAAAAGAAARHHGGRATARTAHRATQHALAGGDSLSVDGGSLYVSTSPKAPTPATAAPSPSADGGTAVAVQSGATGPSGPLGPAGPSGPVSVSGGASEPGTGPTGATGTTGTTGTTGPTGPTGPAGGPASRAHILADGLAQPPADAPVWVKQAIAAGNQLIGKPYVYGGGHASFISNGYDCSGTVSYALHGANLLAAPLDSSQFELWGAAGPGDWITVYTNPQHAYVDIAGIRLDTSRAGDPGGESGPRWRPLLSSNKGFVARHFPGT